MNSHGWIKRPEEGEAQIDIVDRVTALRKVELFSGTPGSVLASLASVAGEVRLAFGEVLLTEGEVGHTLFVVIEGELTAELSGRNIATLRVGSVVGEFAVFVPEPRSATVRAVKASLLLSISKQAIDELLLDYPDVALSIITALVRRFQDRNRFFAAGDQ